MNPEPIEIVRLLDAPPARVFAAWSSAERVARWFSPEGCSVAGAEVNFRAGGVFAVTMRLPGGGESLMRAEFDEVSPPARLVFSGNVEIGGKARFRAHTVVDFVAEGDKTRMTVRQSYELYDAGFAGAPAGAPEGWRTTLDKLARELASERGEATRGA